MQKKSNWLDQFAEQLAKNEKMNKTASLNKKAKQIIVDCGEEFDGVEPGSEVTYKNQAYKLIDANFEDELGRGVVLEALAEVVTAGLEEEVPAEEPAVEPAVEEIAPATGDATDPMTMEMGGQVAPSAGAGQEYHYTNPGDVYHIEVRDTSEVQGFQGAAAATEQQIAQENSVDRTTVDGRYNRIFDRMMSDFQAGGMPAEEAPAVEEEAPVVEEEAPVEEQAVEEVPATEVPAEEPAAEEVAEDGAAEEEIDLDLGVDEEKEEEEPKKEDLVANKILKKIILSK
jgi:hypothetical protein